ncbi:cytochrome c-2 domain protein [Blastomonas sp. RAC04]|jgi:cytochrome c|uniref:c-type cytochrome n=1 Tax=Blastomonas TaxID=150203 RepID=UPI0006B9A6B1|nr:MULTISPECIES: cytochrome c family protein [unclassified Blastomonas]AOF99695.1 cytochrome c-2 domain protein [Blastomonas sp. RAC04]KPF73793.1 cytochrome C [Blastomonas sp. AAP25]
MKAAVPALFAVALAALVPLTQAPVAVAAPAASEAAQGKRLFLRCSACHAVTASAPAKVGPHLQGIVGRKAGAVKGFGYSPAMRSSAAVWNEATLDAWLQRPQAVVPGTSMAFAGLSKPADRKALIAYLKKPVP